MCFKEGLRILKRAYALQRGPTYVLQRESTYFEEGLGTLKRAYVLQSSGLGILKRGYVQVKEGLQSLKRACILQRGLHTSKGPLYLKECMCKDQSTNEGLTVLRF